MAILVLDALVRPAQEAGISVPLDEDGKLLDVYDAAAFPHWAVYSQAQIGQPMPDPTAHWDNAKVVAKIPAAELGCLTWGDLVKKGFRVGYSK